MKNEETDYQKAPVDSPATVGRTAPGEDMVKDGEKGEDDLVDNLPDSHPEPRPTQ